MLRGELHCTMVDLFGTDVSRLTQAARIARENGLGVWLQPRLIDQSHQALLAHLAEAAGAAEELRREYGDIVLNAGCAWTVFSDGIIPGRGYGGRAAKLVRPQWWPAPPAFNHRLNRLLARACQIGPRRVRRPAELCRRAMGAGGLAAVRRDRAQLLPRAAKPAGCARRLRRHLAASSPW